MQPHGMLRSQWCGSTLGSLWQLQLVAAGPQVHGAIPALGAQQLLAGGAEEAQRQDAARQRVQAAHGGGAQVLEVPHPHLAQGVPVERRERNGSLVECKLGRLELQGPWQSADAANAERRRTPTQGSARRHQSRAPAPRRRGPAARPPGGARWAPSSRPCEQPGATVGVGLAAGQACLAGDGLQLTSYGAVRLVVPAIGAPGQPGRRAPVGRRSRRRGVAAALHEGSAGLPPGCTQPAAGPGTLATMGNSDEQQELAGSDEEVELSEVRPWIACRPAPSIYPVSGQRARHRPAAQPWRHSPARAGGALRGAGEQRGGGQRR